MREDRWLQFKGNGLETGPPWPSRGSVEGAFQKVAASSLRALPSALLPYPLVLVLSHSPFLAGSTKAKGRLTEFLEDEGEGMGMARDAERNMIQGSQSPLHTHRPSQASRVPSTILRAHTLVESRDIPSERQATQRWEEEAPGS